MELLYLGLPAMNDWLNAVCEVNTFNVTFCNNAVLWYRYVAFWRASLVEVG